MDTTDVIEGSDGAKLLRVWIAERNAKQYEVADMLNVSGQTVSMICHGKRKPSLELAVRIEKATGIPVEVWT